jgi:hypothetical protein
MAKAGANTMRVYINFDELHDWCTASGTPYDARDIFGGAFAQSSNEVGNVLFSDNTPAGFVHFVEWRTAAPVTVTAFRPGSPS